MTFGQRKPPPQIRSPKYLKRINEMRVQMEKDNMGLLKMLLRIACDKHNTAKAQKKAMHKELDSLIKAGVLHNATPDTCTELVNEVWAKFGTTK